jgi:hypothetical protein
MLAIADYQQTNDRMTRTSIAACDFPILKLCLSPLEQLATHPHGDLLLSNGFRLGVYYCSLC